MSSIPRSGSAHVSQNSDARSAPTTPSRRMPVIDRSQVDSQIVKAAEGMESVFLDHMMQTMRKSVPTSDLSPKSKATEIYQGMLDSEYAKVVAHTGGVGLADLIIAYLDSGQYTHGRSLAAARDQGTVQEMSQNGEAREAVDSVSAQPVSPDEAHLHGGTDAGR